MPIGTPRGAISTLKEAGLHSLKAPEPIEGNRSPDWDTANVGGQVVCP